jgi:hypothetical protein
MTEEEALKMGDDLVAEYHRATAELRAARERVVALCDRLSEYTEKIRAAEQAEQRGLFESKGHR